MSEGGFEEWDADFLDQLIQVEELALTSQHHPPSPALSPPPPPLPYQDSFSYSPPRELSQRIPKTDALGRSSNITATSSVVTSLPYSRCSVNGEELEIDRLKRELGRVSNQLANLEQECLKLKRERDKKEEQLKSVFSEIEEKDSNAHNFKSTNLEYGVHGPRISAQGKKVDSSNDRIDSGVQTDKSCDSSQFACHALSKHFLAIWDSSSGERFGRDLISKLFVACPTEFHALFGCLSVRLPSKITMDTLLVGSPSDLASLDHMPPACSSQSAKVSHFFSVLTKISNGMVRLEALIDALLNLCIIENVVIVQRSLRILHVFMNLLLSSERKSERRDCVMVEGLCLGNNIVNSNGTSENAQDLFCASKGETSHVGYAPFRKSELDTEILWTKKYWDHGSTSVYSVEWVALFEVMRQIALRNTDKYVKLEAVSVMNVILLKTNAYLDREKFGGEVVFGSIMELLRKESGLPVQQQAVHLLYLLLNCPKLLVAFCSACKDEGESIGTSNHDAQKGSGDFSGILDGLADCVACCGSGSGELKLRRNAITVLAFLASSGKSGFEILLSNRLSKKNNFLALILQVLVSEIDIDAMDSIQPPEIFRERTLLIREVLIFLNRLVSNPAYSSIVLRVLTNRRDIASLTIDVANRLSRTTQRHWQTDDMTQKMRETEIVDLARVFKKRVFNYLGENIS